MAEDSPVRLDDRAVIEVAGEGAADFIAGLATVELSHLSPETPRHGALLTPQGKILFDFGIHAAENGVLFDVAQELRDELVKRLMFYRLRLKLDIRPRDDLSVLAAWGEGAEASGLPEDPRGAGLGRRGIGAPGDASDDTAAYHRHRISCGVPECVRDFPPNDVFPHEADLDGLHAVDFDKGCYVGQEVVSRMHHRGTAKKRFVIVTGDAELPAVGAEIGDGEKPVGTMGSSAGTEGLALVRLDRLADALAAGRQIAAEGVALTARVPDWAPFSLSSSASEASA